MEDGSPEELTQLLRKNSDDGSRTEERCISTNDEASQNDTDNVANAGGGGEGCDCDCDHSIP